MYLGHSFWILATGSGEYDPIKSRQLFNLINPLKSDMVTSFPTNISNWRQPRIPAFKSSNAHKPCGWAVIRFRANNPGLWAFHCHIEYHVAIGMATVFDVSSNLVWKPNSTLPTDYGTCGFITSRTPNPHDMANQATNAPVSSNSNSNNDNNIPLTTGNFILIIILTNIASCFIGALLFFGMQKFYNKRPQEGVASDTQRVENPVDSSAVNAKI